MNDELYQFNSNIEFIINRYFKMWYYNINAYCIIKKYDLKEVMI